MTLTKQLLSRTRFDDGNIGKPVIQSSKRSKRELQNIFHWIDDKNIIESLKDSSKKKHYHRRRQVSQQQQQPQSTKDNGQPAVDFFLQPQPTDQPTIPGFTWLTSYSRIPVSEF
ncbi:hypothetical protein BLA29_011991 [Euroglyphus maynei]|uniref:Uncharacterized protein n=1 Tax=Euroglyphus maynei TaxID=6958 RepID=A0A1Y3BFB4_EURMA|nr:hypothetical protein BLA29_011991 [Euroglyphus maynei]